MPTSDRFPGPGLPEARLEAALAHLGADIRKTTVEFPVKD